MDRLPLLEIFYDDNNLEVKTGVISTIKYFYDNSISMKSWFDNKLIRLKSIKSNNKILNSSNYIVINKKYCFSLNNLPKALNYLFGSYLSTEITNKKAYDLGVSIKNSISPNKSVNVTGYNIEDMTSELIRQRENRIFKASQDLETQLYKSSTYAEGKLNQKRADQESLSSFINPERVIILPNGV